MSVPLTAYVTKEGNWFGVRTKQRADGTVLTNEAGVVMEDMGILRKVFKNRSSAEAFAHQLSTVGIAEK